MTEEENIETIQEMYAAFGRADASFILTKLTDDVKWVSHFDAIVPWSGDFSGKDRVNGFFEAIFQSVVEGFDPQEWFAKADTVVSIGEFACRSVQRERGHALAGSSFGSFGAKRSARTNNFTILRWRKPSAEPVSGSSGVDWRSAPGDPT